MSFIQCNQAGRAQVSMTIIVWLIQLIQIKIHGISFLFNQTLIS